jgi:hypothetical protein
MSIHSILIIGALVVPLAVGVAYSIVNRRQVDRAAKGWYADSGWEPKFWAEVDRIKNEVEVSERFHLTKVEDLEKILFDPSYGEYNNK